MKTRNIVILSVLATVAFLYIGMPIISGGVYSISDLFYYAGIQDKTSKLIEQYGGQGISDKYGTLCTTTTYQMWDNTCNFNLAPNKIPSKTPHATTLRWLEELKEFNEVFNQDTTGLMYGTPKCDWIEKQRTEYYKAVDRLPEGDANAEIYLEGISIIEKSIQKHC